ncbi:MAG: carbohydrate ABC transporter permease [Candidatus Eiseniibacteriota bacterium]
MKQSAVRRPARGLVLNLVLAAGALLTLTPLLWMVSASFMAPGEASTLPLRLVPKVPTLEHYITLFTRLDLARGLRNSAIIAVLGTLASLLVTGMAGYAFAKLRFPGRDRIFAVLLLALVIPSQVGMLPLFLLLKTMGLVNTYAGAIVPYVASVFGVFMIRQYALSLPDDLLDAARIDGAGEFRIFWNVVVPALQPILATQAVFTLLSSWNDFLWPLVILSDEAKYTLPVALANLSGEHVQDAELMMAGAVVTVLPVLAAFLVLQRSYVRGVLLGSVKG